MAGNFTQETVEEDASDLIFPKDDKSTSTEYSMKTVKIFEKFPPLAANHQLKYGINYLVSVSGDHWFIYNAAEKTITTGSMEEIYSTEPGQSDLSNTNTNHLSDSFEEWHLKSVIPFEVSNLIAHPNHLGLCLLWGKHGVAVVNIPMNTTPSSNANFSFDGKLNSSRNNDTAVLKCDLVGAELYMETVKLKTLQVKWFPGPGHKLIVVLHSDFHIRLYDTTNPSNSIGEVSLGSPIGTEPQSNQHQYHRGRDPEPDDYYVSSEDVESPIDFDFGPHLPKSNLWTLFILRESGVLYYILMRTIDNIRRCYTELHGPLRVHGELDDKLCFMKTSKSTSIVVTKNFPIFIVTGDLSNTLQHYLLLPDDMEADECVLEEKVLSGELKLYSREKIILETMCESDPNYLVLIPDPHVDHRYVCVTETGVYLIVMEYIPEVRLFVKNDGASNNTLKTSSSTVRFLICWKVNDKSQPDRCLTGLSFCDITEQKLLIVLGDLRAVTFDVSYVSPASYSTKLPNQQQTISKSTSSSSPSPGLGGFGGVSDFEDILKSVKNILKKSTTQPLMCSNQAIEGEDLEKFTIESLDLLLREYVERQEEAMTYIQCTINTLNVKTETVKENLEELMQNRIDLRIAAEGIAELYDECANKNDTFRRRLEACLHRQQLALPAMTDQEKQWRKKLEDIHKDTYIFKTWIDSLRARVKEDKERDVNERQSVPISLAPYQILDFKKEVTVQHKTILDLTREIKDLKHALGVV